MTSDSSGDMGLVDPVEVEMRLRCGDFNDHLQLFDELKSAGSSANVAVPALLQAYANGNLVGFESSLLALYHTTTNEDIFAALEERGGLRHINLSEKAALYAAGHAQFEDQLLDYVFAHYKSSSEVFREDVIRALGQTGGKKVLKVLLLVRARIGEDIAVARTRNANDERLERCRKAMDMGVIPEDEDAEACFEATLELPWWLPASLDRAIAAIQDRLSNAVTPQSTPSTGTPSGFSGWRHLYGGGWRVYGWG